MKEPLTYLLAYIVRTHAWTVLPPYSFDEKMGFFHGTILKGSLIGPVSVCHLVWCGRDAQLAKWPSCHGQVRSPPATHGVTARPAPRVTRHGVTPLAGRRGPAQRPRVRRGAARDVGSGADRFELRTPGVTVRPPRRGVPTQRHTARDTWRHTATRRPPRPSRLLLRRPAL